MSGTDPAATLAVVVARLDDVREDITMLRAEVAASRQDVVTRGEWQQRNAHVDSRLTGQGREIGDLRTELHSRRAPWWAVASAVVAGLAFAWSVLGPVLQAG